MRYEIRLAATAEADLLGIFHYISEQSSPERACGYLGRVRGFLASLDVFPERGTVRDELRPGLRVIGFERRISVAFIIENDSVVVLRLLYGGRHADFADE